MGRQALGRTLSSSRTKRLRRGTQSTVQRGGERMVVSRPQTIESWDFQATSDLAQPSSDPVFRRDHVPQRQLLTVWFADTANLAARPMNPSCSGDISIEMSHEKKSGCREPFRRWVHRHLPVNELNSRSKLRNHPTGFMSIWTLPVTQNNCRFTGGTGRILRSAKF